METTNILDFERRDGATDALTDLLRTGAQHLIATAVKAELADYLAQFADLRTQAGHAVVVRKDITRTVFSRPAGHRHSF